MRRQKITVIEQLYDYTLKITLGPNFALPFWQQFYMKRDDISSIKTQKYKEAH